VNTIRILSQICLAIMLLVGFASNSFAGNTISAAIYGAAIALNFALYVLAEAIIGFRIQVNVQGARDVRVEETKP
jgi:hypothetical protein